MPSREELLPILTAAARTPDHGKLEPWRFAVLTRPALERIAQAVPEAGARLGEGPERIGKMVSQFADAHLAVAVIASPKPSEKIPEIEQVLSAGAVCLALLNAALAAGWGANGLTGWAVHDRQFATGQLGLARTHLHRYRHEQRLAHHAGAVRGLDGLAQVPLPELEQGAIGVDHQIQ